MAMETNCSPDKCEAHNTDADQDKYETGACTYDIWNSLSAIHNVSDMRSNFDIRYGETWVSDITALNANTCALVDG